MDPDSGEPLWLLVRDGRIGGRHTLVPFAQAASGAGHVWIPFEREVVRGAPAVRPSAPLSHELSDTLRRYYAESGHPVGATGGGQAEEALRPSPSQQSVATAATPRAPEPPRVTAQAAAAASSPRRPAPPPLDQPPPRYEQRRPGWTSPEHAAPPEPPPLPPLPPRTAPRRAPHQSTQPAQPAQEERFAAPRPQESWATRQFEPPPAPRTPPLRPDQAARQAPPQPQPQQPAPSRQPTLEELRLTVGDGVDMELVGRLQFRGNVVRVQPLDEGADARP